MSDVFISCAREEGDCGRRVLRGGSWDDGPLGMRSAFRYRLDADYAGSIVGFRLAQDL